ncbi:hypothetical protein FRX31_011044 [Thalictrum thalictroides]|uniref:Uncharacterized protein n=1 Tax=Thalictrum thalictroides TaxID=46969 RepID=A0A7J6WRZ5_THATH|nr:hypothetical protein FRX31_011044 [Thalictrum thalictroides]
MPKAAEGLEIQVHGHVVEELLNQYNICVSSFDHFFLFLNTLKEGLFGLLLQVLQLSQVWFYFVFLDLSPLQPPTLGIGSSFPYSYCEYADIISMDFDETKPNGKELLIEQIRSYRSFLFSNLATRPSATEKHQSFVVKSKFFNPTRVILPIHECELH